MWGSGRVHPLLLDFDFDFALIVRLFVLIYVICECSICSPTQTRPDNVTGNYIAIFVVVVAALFSFKSIIVSMSSCISFDIAYRVNREAQQTIKKTFSANIMPNAKIKSSSKKSSMANNNQRSKEARKKSHAHNVL